MESMSHRYAAILAADVAHYSTLMEGDGEGTVQALKDCRSVFQRCVSEFHGHEFGSVGDSLMAEFSSPVDALRAARCIHTSLEHDVPPLMDGNRMQVRIGLHAGDVIDDGDNLFGDVVNTASRVQQLAQPGSIAVSELVHEQVQKEANFAFRSLGRHSLKNIAEPIQVFEVVRQQRRVNWRRLRLAVRPYRAAVAAVLGVAIASVLIISWLETQTSSGISGVIEVPDPYSVAVLPFTYVGEDGNADLQINSLQGDIVAQLTPLRLPNRVARQKEIDAVLARGTSIEEIAKALSVEYVVENDVRQSGDFLRIDIRLFNTTTSAYEWSASYDGRLGGDNLLITQSEIAWDIAVALHLQLPVDRNQDVDSLERAGAEARNEVLLGQDEMGKLNREGLLQAQSHFERAIELDPFYVQAHVGRADSLGLQVWLDPGVSIGDRIGPWRESIATALALDPKSGEAHVSLAFLRALQESWQEEEQLLIRAKELSPDYYASYYLHALLLDGQGRDDESIVQFRKAFERNPHWPMLIRDFSRRLFELGHVEEAEIRLLDGIKQYPQFSRLYRELYMVWIDSGRSGDALRALNAWTRIEPGRRTPREWICFALIHLSDFDEAEDCITKLEADFEQSFVVHRIMLSTVRDQPDKALEHLDQFADWERLVPIARHFIGQQYVFHNLTEKAVRFADDLAPEMLGERDITITSENIEYAILAGAVLQHQGRIDRANYVFEQTLEAMRFMPRNRGESIQFRDIQVYVLRGEKNLAISSLRDAVKQNWRGGFWYLHTPLFSAMNEEPEWRMLVEQLNLEMAEEVKWYHEHKNDPLF